MHLPKVRPCVADPDSGAAQDVYQVQVEDVAGGEGKSMSLGIGAMLGMLGGNEDSVKAFKSCVGKVIKELTLEEDSGLYFVMDDDTKMRLFDNGQSCCEYRYMRTDDKLEDFIGSKLLGAVLKSADNISSEWGDHEIEFLDVQTDRGVFQMVNHNEHNGYYGGFSIRAELK